jgi:hypothetical protein
MLDSSVNVDTGRLDHSLLGKHVAVRWIWPDEKRPQKSGTIVAVWRSGTTVYVTVAMLDGHITIDLSMGNPLLVL